MLQYEVWKIDRGEPDYLFGHRVNYGGLSSFFYSYRGVDWLLFQLHSMRISATCSGNEISDVTCLGWLDFGEGTTSILWSTTLESAVLLAAIQSGFIRGQSMCNPYLYQSLLYRHGDLYSPSLHLSISVDFQNLHLLPQSLARSFLSNTDLT